MIIYPDDLKKDKRELTHELRCYCTKCDKPFLDEKGELVDKGYFRMCDDCFKEYADALIKRIAKVLAERRKEDDKSCLCGGVDPDLVAHIYYNMSLLDFFNELIGNSVPVKKEGSKNE